MSRYVVVDLEMCNVPYKKRSDGFKCKNEIIQIGAALLDESLNVCDTYMSYVHPEYGVIDAVIENLTGITDADVIDAPSCNNALHDFAAWLPEDARLVSWSVNDELQLKKETREKNIDIPKLNKISKKWIDCQKTFGSIMCSSRCYGLVDALNMSSIDYDLNIHDALVDAKNTALLFAKMKREKEFKLSPYISIGECESSGYRPFADLLKNFCFE